MSKYVLVVKSNIDDEITITIGPFDWLSEALEWKRKHQSCKVDDVQIVHTVMHSPDAAAEFFDDEEEV